MGMFINPGIGKDQLGTQSAQYSTAQNPVIGGNQQSSWEQLGEFARDPAAYMKKFGESFKSPFAQIKQGWDAVGAKKAADAVTAAHNLANYGKAASGTAGAAGAGAGAAGGW